MVSVLGGGFWWFLVSADGLPVLPGGTSRW